MKAKHKKALVCFAALGLFLGSAIFDEAKAQYVEPESYTTVIDGNNGGEQLFTSDEKFNYYHFKNINSEGQNGGALVAKGKINNSLFENNSANRGGAFFTPTTSGLSATVFETVKFLGNKAETIGGAISSDTAMLQVNNSIFEKNTSGTRGGAIHYLSSPSFGMNILQNCEFIDNEAGQDGGAIYVSLGSSTELKITANDGKTHYFTGNMHNVNNESTKPSSNAVYIEKGKVTFQTLNSPDSRYVVNDGIQGASAYSMDAAKLFIQANGGSVEFNDEVKNLVLTHTSGTLELNKADKIANGGSILNNVDLLLKPASKKDIRLDMQNEKIDNLKIRNFSVTNPTAGNKIVIAMDVDLKDGVADNFEVTQGMSGKLQFDAEHFELNIIEDGDSDKFQLFNRAFDIEGEVVQFIGNAKYVFSVGDDGFINVSKDPIGGLYNAITTDTSIREFKPDPAMDIVVSSNLGTMGGDSLILNLVDSDFHGSGFSGVTVSENQRLELKNIGSADGEKSMHDFSRDYGSVVKNEGGTVVITDSVIKNNTATKEGGAIYSKDGEIILNAETKKVILSNNRANGSLNDIYMEQSTSAARSVFAAKESPKSVLIVKGDQDTVVESGIKGNGEIRKQGAGVFELGGDNSGFTGDFYLESGEFRLGQNAVFINTVNSYFSDGTKFNLINNSPNDNINLGNVNLDGNVLLGIDADASTGASDKIGATSVLGEGKILIDKINLTSLNNPTLNNANFSVIKLDENGNSPLLGNVELSAQNSEIMGPIYKYKMGYNPETGLLTLSGGGKNSDGYNPSVLASPVATLVGGYLTQLHSYDMAFNNADNYMLMPLRQRQAIKNMNKYASLGSSLFSISGSRENQNAWFKPYSTLESVKLKNGPRVSNVAYGSFFGYDSDIIELNNGFDGTWSVYAGYNGSHQAYQGNSIWQNGGTLGATGVLYKGNFFTALTANVGASSGQASTMFGTEDFTMLATGIAAKTGYNIETFDGKFIIQPNYLMSYSFVKTFDYKNSAGLDLDAKPLNAIQIAPGLRMIGNLPKGFQPYVGCSMVWNIIDDTKFKANDVSLPELSVKPYFNYGLGVQKRGKRLSGYLQTMFRSGGRSGIGIQAGLQLSI